MNMVVEHDTNTIAISVLYEMFERGKLIFTKQDVFSEENQLLVVDSILNQFPIGSIVFAQFIDNQGKTTIKIIDGNKRLHAIFTYIQNNIQNGIPGNMWTYTPVIEYYNSEDEEKLNEIVKRLNRCSC